MYKNIVLTLVEHGEVITTSLGNLFQCLISLSAKNVSLMSSVNFPWGSFTPFPCVYDKKLDRKIETKSQNVPGWKGLTRIIELNS